MHCVVECSQCGYVFVEYKGIMSPCIAHNQLGWYEKLYRSFKGRCPICKHKLPKPEGYAEKIKIKVVPHQ